VAQLAENDRADGCEYTLIAGFRRTYAHVFLQRKTIKAVIRPPITSAKAQMLNLTENLSRKDLNILQEARAISKIYSPATGMTQQVIADALNVSQHWVATRLSLLTLPEAIQQDAAAGILDQYTIKKLAAIKSPEKQCAIVLKIKQQKESADKGKDKPFVFSRKKPKPHSKRVRSVKEVNEFIGHLLDTVGAGPHTRVLAWAAGNISDNELQDFLRETWPEFAFGYKEDEEEVTL